MTLYERILATKAGQHAMYLRDLHYNHGHKLEDRVAKQLLDAANFLESVAIAQMKRESEETLREINEDEKRKIAKGAVDEK